jgi:CBS domain-containing protein
MRHATSDTCTLREDDIRAALHESRNTIRVPEKDLQRIYEVALRHAKDRQSAQTQVRDLMTHDVIRTTADADLHEAARLLSEHRISGMPVVDGNERVIGVISEADVLVLAGMKRGHSFRDILHSMLGGPVRAGSPGATVGSVMSFPPITSKADDTIDEVAAILNERRIKRLPVVNDDGILIGIVCRADIVRFLSRKR